MTKNKNITKKQPPESNLWRKMAFSVAIFSFILLVFAGFIMRSLELDQRNATALQLSKAIADTALSDPSISMEETILKISDLFLIEAVLGVKIIDGRTTPLSVGETLDNFPENNKGPREQIHWPDGVNEIDVAFKMLGPIPFDWFVIRLDSSKIMEPAFFGTALSLLIAPVFSIFLFIVINILINRKLKSPFEELENYFHEKGGHFYLSEMPNSLVQQTNQWGKMARQIENSRKAFKNEKQKLEYQVGFLNETPFPLLRCSVNRKVLYANSAAKALPPLFGDETCEFVSPALSEVVRKAFHDTKEIHADIRLGDYIMTFRAIPVLDSGYINLYGEHSRKEPKA